VKPVKILAILMQMKQNKFGPSLLNKIKNSLLNKSKNSLLNKIKN